MKKFLTVLMGGVVLLSIASCDKDNKALVSMIEGKSSAEVVGMISEKYSDKAFIEEYTKQDVKFEAAAHYAVTTSSFETSIKYDVNAVADLDKGLYAKVSEIAEMKIGKEITQEKVTMEAEYDIASDNLYHKETSNEYSKSTCYTGVMATILAEIGDVPSELPDDTETETPDENPIDLPSLDEVKAILEEYMDKVQVDVVKDNLVLSFTTDAELNAKAEAVLGSYTGLAGYLTNTTATVSISFNEDLFFTGINASCGTSISMAQYGVTESISLTAGASLTLNYGTHTYTSIKDKDTFIQVPFASVL